MRVSVCTTKPCSEPATIGEAGLSGNADDLDLLRPCLIDRRGDFTAIGLEGNGNHHITRARMGQIVNGEAAVTGYRLDRH